MDLFYKNVQVEKKQRVHFNAFMLDVHDSKRIDYLIGHVLSSIS